MTIRIAAAHDNLPGERLHTLTTPDMQQIAWCARPDDRRGASLIADGLTATGVEWMHNPVRRVDLDGGAAVLISRFRAFHTSHLIVAHAHYLSSPSRQVVDKIADQVDCDLSLVYEGTGTTMRQTGIVDHAERRGWPHVDFGQLPFHMVSHVEAVTDEDSPIEAFPGAVPRVGFPLFRYRCRCVLTAEQFRQVDVDYTGAYFDTIALPTVTPELIAAFVQRRLSAAASYARCLTRVRAIQAALFSRGWLWHLDDDELYAWLSHDARLTPSAGDYRRLRQLLDPNIAAVAVLTAMGYGPATMATAQLVDHCTVTTLEGHSRLDEEAALILRIAAVHNGSGGNLVAGHQTWIARAQKFLAYQFGFPLTIARGSQSNDRACNPLHPDRIVLTAYREEVAS